MDERKRYEAGMKARREVLGDAYVDRAQERLNAFNEEFQDLITRYSKDPAWIKIDSVAQNAPQVEQIYFEVAQRDKVRGLHELIDRELKGRTLVFSRTRRGVDFVADQLGSAGVRNVVRVRNRPGARSARKSAAGSPCHCGWYIALCAAAQIERGTAAGSSMPHSHAGM